MIKTFNNLLKRFVGDKTASDIQEIQPLVDKVLEAEKGIAGISNDELRAKSAALKVQIAEYVKPIEEEINQLKLQAESNKEIEIDAKEAIYDRVDALIEEVNVKLEEILEQLLPEAFAIVKERPDDLQKTHR